MQYSKSEHIKITGLEQDLERVYEVLDDYLKDIDLSGKKALRFRLLTEEVVRLIKSIISNNSLELWFEGTNRLSNIKLISIGQMDDQTKKELGSISTSGQVVEEKGFFGELISLFLIKDSSQDSDWSLKEYEDKLRAKKAEDKFSMEAWEDLERSLVGNLADDIEIKVRKNKVEMTVVKDFTDSLAFVSTGRDKIVSNQIFAGTGKAAAKSLNRAEDVICELGMSHEDELHAKLLFEETMGMLAAMTGNYIAVIWFEKYKKSYCLKLTARTQMDYDKKQDFLDMSSSRRNENVKGFMGKVMDVIENGILDYEKVMKLSQTYCGTYIDYGNMGMYGVMEMAPDCGIMWSLNDYKDSLSDEKDTEEGAKEAWDELEKSIVASLATDVLVGVKGDRVDMTIICECKG
ncbi:hypothetical protein [Butyrivibrio proteoclasticus]|uniref:hypothetical protein n=1 Tax=Butyrivibrio proteoclasticus TaxID=43305 RepID=UPI00047E4CB8|nr:hypothetical protein [Butyrivibrio proteoclasticus]